MQVSTNQENDRFTVVEVCIGRKKQELNNGKIGAVSCFFKLDGLAKSLDYHNVISSDSDKS